VREQGLGGALLESSLLNIVRLYREDRASKKRAVCGEGKGFQSTAKTRKSERVLLVVFGLHTEADLVVCLLGGSIITTTTRVQEESLREKNTIIATLIEILSSEKIDKKNGFHKYTTV
jgi:hypothetical protein